VAGVEDYDESMKLMAEAYQDAVKIKIKNNVAMNMLKIIVMKNCKKLIAPAI
jgi:hypothetical protein